MNDVKITVRQVRSGIGAQSRDRRTLKALGLGRVNSTRQVPDNPAVRGMLQKVRHLVTVEGEGSQPAVRAEE